MATVAKESLTLETAKQRGSPRYDSEGGRMMPWCDLVLPSFLLSTRSFCMHRASQYCPRRLRTKSLFVRHDPSIKWTPRSPNRFQRRTSHTSSGKRTCISAASAGFSASVRESSPGPVVFRTTNSERERKGTPVIIGWIHAGSFCALKQFAMTACRNGWPRAAPKA